MHAQAILDRLTQRILARTAYHLPMPAPFPLKPPAPAPQRRPPTFTAAGLRFACQPDCGACCSRPGQVRLDRAEARAMAAALAMGQAAFRRRWMVNVRGALRLVDGPDGACPFLGEDLRCRVYEARPAQCRRYPFWPELLTDAATWEWEALRCPGIGQGPLISVEEIAVWGAA